MHTYWHSVSRRRQVACPEYARVLVPGGRHSPQ
jgi:hypothetical protein|eukprot:COSAG01_NODE_6819_length_3483_cov_24.232565_4_plen_33_part_00